MSFVAMATIGKPSATRQQPLQTGETRANLGGGKTQIIGAQ